MRADRNLIVAGAFLRATAIGFLGVLLGLHLAARGLDPDAIGAVIAAGLAGAAAAALAVTVVGDRIGRRAWLVITSLLGAVGALGAIAATDAWTIGAAACIGMLNGMGRDRGASAIVDQAALPATTDDARRTRAFAIYHLAQDIGHALGALLASIGGAARPALAIYGVACVALALLYAQLSPAVDAQRTPRPPPLSPTTRRRVATISALFALDAVGGGFLSSALLAVIFIAQFDATPTEVAILFAASRVLNALSHLGAAWLAKRIGLVRTMVFTHMPSSLLLVTVAFAPSFTVAAILFLLREGLVEMDVPTRQSYVMAVVAPAERTRVAGITQLVRLAGWATGPLVAGALMSRDQLVAPLVVAASLKLLYDILLYVAFRAVRPPEEMS